MTFHEIKIEADPPLVHRRSRFDDHTLFATLQFEARRDEDLLGFERNYRWRASHREKMMQSRCCAQIESELMLL